MEDVVKQPVWASGRKCLIQEHTDDEPRNFEQRTSSSGHDSWPTPKLTIEPVKYVFFLEYNNMLRVIFGGSREYKQAY